MTDQEQDLTARTAQIERREYRCEPGDRAGRSRRAILRIACPFCGAPISLRPRALSRAGETCDCGARFFAGGRCQRATIDDRAPSAGESPPAFSAPAPIGPEDRSPVAAIEILRRLGLASLRVAKTARSRPGRPQHEVLAPAGFRFLVGGDPGPHGLIRGTRDQAMLAGASAVLVPCDPGCRCRSGAGEELA